MQTIDTQKAGLRKHMLALRRAMSIIEKEEAERRMAKRLLARAEVQRATTICIYLSTSDEADTLHVVEQLFRLEKTVVVPKAENMALSPYKISSLNDVAPGSFGILEPISSCLRVLSSDIDIFIVPCVAWDMRGFRLGYGKGYYDRLLRGISVPRIGLAFDVQCLAEVPRTSYDVPVTHVVTETRTVSI